MKLKLLMIAGAVSIIFAGCLKSTPYMDVSDTQPIIEFGLSPASGNYYYTVTPYLGWSDSSEILPQLLSTTPLAQDTGTLDTAVALVVAAPQPLSSAVTATVEVDTAALSNSSNISYMASCNAAYYDTTYTYTALPDSLYTLTPSCSIAAGYTIGNLPVTLNFSKFPASYHYALSLQITGAQTASGDTLIVSGNSSNFIWLFDK